MKITFVALQLTEISLGVSEVLQLVKPRLTLILLTLKKLMHTCSLI